VAGILHQEETDAVRFGEVFETIILYATSLGLQTCWLGGTFQREAFARSLKLEGAVAK
jgi:nitroreductase